MPPIILAFEWSPSVWPPARMVPVRLAALAHPRLAPASPPAWHLRIFPCLATHASLPARRSRNPCASPRAALPAARALLHGAPATCALSMG